MKRSIATGVFIMLSIVTAGRAYAQEGSPGPGKAEVTIIPAGWTHFTRNTTTAEPSFGSYNLGGAVSYNFNRLVGIEGEVGGSIATRQSLDGFGGLITNEKPPSMLSYSGNVVVNAAGRAVVPYATGGIGGLSLYSREVLGVTTTESFLTGNVGGGVKWFSSNGRWGLRGDYRLQVVKSKTDAPAFFGQDTRFGQRVYAGFIINAVR
jgi:hypothetical protein